MSILKRTVYYSHKGGQIKFLDWAHTMTTIGACAEPFCIDDRYVPSASTVDFDPSDEISKVDELARVEDDDAVKRALSGNDRNESPPIHGGNLHPRVLIFTGNN